MENNRLSIIKDLVDSLSAETAPGSISPARVGGILSRIIDLIGDDTDGFQQTLEQIMQLKEDIEDSKNSASKASLNAARSAAVAEVHKKDCETSEESARGYKEAAEQVWEAATASSNNAADYRDQCVEKLGEMQNLANSVTGGLDSKQKKLVSSDDILVDDDKLSISVAAIRRNFDCLWESIGGSILADGSYRMTELGKALSFYEAMGRYRIDQLIRMWKNSCVCYVGTSSSIIELGRYDEQECKFIYDAVSYTSAANPESLGTVALTENEVRVMMALRDNGSSPEKSYHRRWMLKGVLPSYIADDSVLDNAFASCRGLEIAAFYGYYPATRMLKSFKGVFNGCSNLKYIVGAVLDFSLSPDSIDFQNAFNGCSKLEEVRIKGLKKSISFVSSPKISLASLEYLVNNAANTDAVTVTVHADIFKKLTTFSIVPPDGERDEEEARWLALSILADEKEIQFATA